MTQIANKTLDTKSFVARNDQSGVETPAAWSYSPSAFPLEDWTLTHLGKTLSGDRFRTTTKLVIPRVDASGTVLGTTYVNLEITRDKGLPTASVTDARDVVVGFLNDADFLTNLTTNATFF